MIEYEKKIVLAGYEYNYLLSYVPATCLKVTQINRYFDTVYLEKHTNGITCRIREKNGSYIATEKSHQVGPIDASLEFSCLVSGPYDISPFQTEGLVYQGFLTTERTVWMPEKGVRICLDKNIYLGKEDYEMEIEYDDEKVANKWLWQIAMDMVTAGILHSAWILFYRIGQSSSKATRFFMRKMQYNNGIEE